MKAPSKPLHIQIQKTEVRESDRIFSSLATLHLTPCLQESHE